MQTETENIRVDRLLSWWGNNGLKHPWLILLLALCACAYCLNFTINNLGVNTNTAEMFSQDLPFQQNRIRFERTFPQDAGTIAVVVEASTPELTTNAVLELGKLLAGEKKYVKSIYLTAESDFFDQNGLLYLDLEDLEDLTTELARAQPFMGRLSKDYSLNGLLSILGYAIETTDESLPLEIDPLLAKVRKAVNAVVDGEFYQLSWQKLMYGESRTRSKQIIMVRPSLDFEALLPAGESIGAVRQLISKVEKLYPSTRVRITGEAALEHEEMESLLRDSVIAGIISLTLVCTSLLIGLQSLRLMLATFVNLIMGLIFTAWFASVAVGHLNLISISFAVLYIGLGVDYAIHICLRYREFIRQQLTNRDAIIACIRSVGPSLILCALTTAIGFYAFVPTDFAGVSELGIISGSGMFIGLIISLIVLPAILKVLPLTSAKREGTHFPDRIYTIPFRYARAIRWISLLLAGAAILTIAQVSFDSNPINLRDPRSESVVTFKELLKSRDESPYALTLLAEDKEAALASAERLSELPSVDKTVTIFDFVPDNQEDKIELIENMSLLLGPQIDSFVDTPGGNKRKQALDNFLQKVNNGIASRQANGQDAGILIPLQDRLKKFLATLESSQNSGGLLETLENSLLGAMPVTMNKLNRGLDAYEFNLDDIPGDLRQRWLSDEGIYRVQVVPKKDLNHPENLRQFVDEVETIESKITGLPVVEQASGKAVVRAFQQAFIGALLAITALLLVALRSVRKSLLVLLPLLLAGAYISAIMVVSDRSFNFVNIIALPLLLGLGVDSSIHIVERLRAGSSNPLRTSTSRAIFFSNLTTLFSFTSLAFTAHLGLSSMGFLLTVGIAITLICTLFVVPAFSGVKLGALSSTDLANEVTH